MCKNMKPVICVFMAHLSDKCQLWCTIPSWEMGAEMVLFQIQDWMSTIPIIVFMRRWIPLKATIILA